ncbi:MAG: TolC family protein, partial [Gluconacetobacter liquefaciens]
GNTRGGVQGPVPRPSEARNVPMRMKAVREIAAAEREERQTRRAVRADYSRALARLAASLDILRHASGRDRVLARRIEDLRKGWVTGETPVIEYLRARQAGLEARLQQQTASVEWRGAIAQMMIMAGETP